MSTLKEQEASLISQAWPFSSEETESFLQWLIRNFPSIAIRSETGELVAHMILEENGSLGHLRVLPEHRRKGIGQFVVTELARKTIPPGEVSYLFTITEESYRLHLKCGYNKIMDTVWTFDS